MNNKIRTNCAQPLTTAINYKHGSKLRNSLPGSTQKTSWLESKARPWSWLWWMWWHKVIRKTKDKDNRSRGESSGERTLVQLEEDEDGLVNRMVDHHSVVIHPHFSEYALCRPNENQEWLHNNNNIVIMQFPTFVSSSGAPWAYREKGNICSGLSDICVLSTIWIALLQNL